MAVINTSECEKCKHGIIDEGNKAKVKVKCEVRNKTYYFGQIIPCDDKEKKLKSNKGEELCTN